MILEAFAKINWSLDICGIRDDGYHLMDMLMQPVSISDEITLIPSQSLSITTDGWPPVRADESNLAFQAAKMMQDVTGHSDGVSIHIHKHIPVGAGMGGGSADAAAVLIGLNQLWGTALEKESLEKMGLSLGADVPFFIRGGLTRTRGIGEKLEDLEYMYDYRLIIVQPCAGLSTAQVFRLWHSTENICHPDTESALNALKRGQLIPLCESIGNVLQPVAVALRPEISQACQLLKKLGAVNAIMTGSGSAVFGVFPSETASKKAYQVMKPLYKTIFLCHTQHDSIRFIEES